MLVYDKDIEVLQTGKNVIKKFKEIENDSCYIVFWESLSILFTRCHYCNAKVENIHNYTYTKGAMLAVQTICEINIFSNGRLSHYLINDL